MTQVAKVTADEPAIATETYEPIWTLLLLMKNPANTANGAGNGGKDSNKSGTGAVTEGDGRTVNDEDPAGQGDAMQPIPHRSPYTALWLYVQHRFGPRRLEWGMSLVMCSIAIGIWNTDAFSRPAWKIFQTAFGSEGYMALVMFSLGMLRLIGLIINGARKHATPQIRQFAAAIGAFIWAGMSYCFWQSDSSGLALYLFPWFFVFELDNILQASRDQEHVKRYERSGTH